MSVQVNDQNLGHATAYGYASSKGYTGTEDEFAELMASYADVAEQAAESAEQAAASATTATAKASEAAQSATAAASSKTAAETAQGGAETAAQTATTKAGEASTAATTATNKATEATTAATTATGKATEAAGSATTATTKAGEASTSATNAAASATRAQEILDSIPADYSQLSDDVEDLKDGFNEIENILEITEGQPLNLIDMSKFTIDGQYYNSAAGASGSHSDNASYKSYDSLIAVEPSTSYVLSDYYRNALIAVSLLYLDSDGGYLSGGYNVNSPFSTPANAKYIRLSIGTARYNLGQVMLEKGSVPSPIYIPYATTYTYAGAIEQNDDIVCWGDSLTYGTGTSTPSKTYPNVLSKKTGRKVFSCGFPGDTSLEIAGMQGAIPMMVKAPFTIPASGSVEIEIYDAMLSADTPFRFPSIDALAGVNPVTIGGIKGNLDLSASSNPNSRVFTFTRLEAGDAKAFTWYEPIIASCSADRNSDIAIIWVGTNGGWESNIQTLANQIRQMVNNIKAVDKKYIVIGLTTGTTQTRSALETLLTNTFGGHFVNARAYMSEQAIYDENITPTESDLAEMAEGKTPESLRYDATHLNDKGYDAIATLVYNRGKSLGYWG